MPLESLSSELDAYLAVLRNRLLEVINEHYADFVSLSSRLVNVDTAVLRMQKPLLEIRVCLHFKLQLRSTCKHRGAAKGLRLTVVNTWLCSASLSSQDKLLAVRDSVSGALDYLRDGLNRRQDVASIRALLEVMQDAGHVMAKVAPMAADAVAETATDKHRQLYRLAYSLSCMVPADCLVLDFMILSP